MFTFSSSVISSVSDARGSFTTGGIHLTTIYGNGYVLNFTLIASSDASTIFTALCIDLATVDVNIMVHFTTTAGTDTRGIVAALRVDRATIDVDTTEHVAIAAAADAGAVLSARGDDVAAIDMDVAIFVTIVATHTDASAFFTTLC